MTERNAAANALGLLEGHRVERDDLVSDIGTGLRHPLGRPDVTLGDLGKPAILGGGPHGRFDEPFVGQAVEHHIDTGTVGVREDLVGEIRCA